MPWKSTATTEPGANLDKTPVLAKPAYWLSLLAYLVTLACGSLALGTTAFGQSPDEATLAFLSKLRSIEKFATNNARPSSPPSDTDSSVADVPSPQRLAELFELALRPSPTDRNRFFLADSTPRGKQRRERLKDALQSAGLLEELIALVQPHATAQPPDELSPRVGSRSGLLDPAQALLTILSEPSEKANAEDAIQVKRSSANFPLLGWGPGTYQSARSEHFAIASQAGEKPTAEVATACEWIFSIWHALFGDRFEFPDGETQAFRVVLFRNREAYVQALKTIEPRISISTGYYSPEHRMAFFYWDGQKSIPTLVHELTHQFFDATATQTARFNADSDPGAWAIEAVALYMESWSEEHLGGLSIVDIGGWDAPRLQAGRFRRLRDQYWIPWDEFSMADGKRLRADPDVAAWYSQACGLAHFWLDADPTSRDRFLSYLHDVYQGQGGKAASILTDDDSLRTAYDQYLLTGSNPAGDPHANFLVRPGFMRRNEIVLTRCPIESQTLLHWPLGLRKLAWLDLGFTQIDDELFAQAESTPWDVSRLNLESTNLSDASLIAIASMKSLTELDISGCKVTDAGLEALSKHPNLKQLWLTNTSVTDRSIEVLLSLPKLERLEASGSLSVEGYKKLLKKKPRLKKP